MIRTTFLLLTILSIVPVDAAAGPETPGRPARWSTGSEFERRLAAPATVLWSEAPLKSALLSFAHAQGIAIVLDRRVDPDRELEVAVRQGPVFEIVCEVAAGEGLRACRLSDLLYVGPPETASRLRTVVEVRRREVRRLGTAAVRRFASKEPLAWGDLDTPRQLLNDLAANAGLEIVNPESVPHDLWAAAELPRLSLIERLSLLLAQFDLTFRVAPDGRRIALVPIPERVAIVRDYPGGKAPSATVERLREIAPECDYRAAEGRVFVRGTLEEHERIGAALGGNRERDAHRPPNGRSATSSDRGGAGPSATTVYTVAVPNRPLGEVLRQFAWQIGLELEIDRAGLEAAGVSLDQLVSFEVENATLDALFEAILGPVGCVHERAGRVLNVRAKSSDPDR